MQRFIFKSVSRSIRMTKKQEIHISKFLSLVLRHKPEEIGIHLNENGWTDVQILMSKMNAKDFYISLEDLKSIVQNNDKKRFILNSDFTQIRANQGHSVKVELDLQPMIPPKTLFHGTATRNVDSIKEKGLIKGQRHHVHLSAHIETARKVGMRYGKPIVLMVHSEKMNNQGILFYKSENDVWLTDYVDSQFINFGND